MFGPKLVGPFTTLVCWKLFVFSRGKNGFVKAKAVCIYPSTVLIRSEPLVTTWIAFCFTADCATSLARISPCGRLQLFLVHFHPKKPRTQNFRWFLHILLCSPQPNWAEIANEEVCPKSLLRKLS